VLVGQDARAWRPVSEALGDSLALAPAARCAVETALLDALARHYRVPLYVLLGGAQRTLDIDMTVTAGDVAHARQSAQAILARGISTLKEELEREDVPLALFEQPVPAHDVAGMAELTRRSRVPVCADEPARSGKDVLRLIREGAAHAINIKTMKCGIVEALQMWSLARTAGLELMVGGMVESVLAMSASAHLAAGLGGFTYADLDTPLFIASHPFQGGARYAGAKLELPADAPGHGVTLA